MADPLGRTIRGLLTYNPGPGIYSRLERAIEAMPESVRVQELPGLLKRYKDGVPGWELKATDLDSTIASRDVVPRDELLYAVRARSPVYTHNEIVLGGSPPVVRDESGIPGWSSVSLGDFAVRQTSPSPLGGGVHHGDPKYQSYGQGGDQYTEIVITQPWNFKDTEMVQDQARDIGHWSGWLEGQPKMSEPLDFYHAAHARFDTHGDALRINELQSDRGIHNRKAREWQANNPGEEPTVNVQELDFPLEDAWADIIIKRLALEAARRGHRAIEVASPRAIADKVGGSIENYEHFYGKVVPGALERLGRKMGGLTRQDAAAISEPFIAENPQYAYHQDFRDQMRAATGEDQLGPNFWRLYSGMRYDSLPPSQRAVTYDRFGGSHPTSQGEGGLPQEMYEYLHRLGLPPEAAQRITSQAIYLAPHNAKEMHNAALQEQVEAMGKLTRRYAGEVGRRYIMSDEMRRRLIQEGVGAAIATGVMSQDDLIERLNQ